jgi:dolichol-phosphate mannosyltransferase
VPSNPAEPVEVSIVGPVFNEVDGITEFHRRLQSARAGLGCRSEVVYVDDGSSDGSLQTLISFHAEDPSVRVLSLSRNFGHQVAVSAGIDHTSGQATVVIDTDLQDPPEVIPELVASWRSGAQVVSAVRSVRRGEPRWRLLVIRAFYRLVRRLTSLDIKLDSGDFRLMDRAVVDIVRSMPERDRFIRGMTAWVGLRQESVLYERDARFAGDSKYPVSRLMQLAMAAVTSFSLVPLQLAGAVGLILGVLSLLAIPVIVAARIAGVEGLGGQTTVLLGVVFLGSIQLFCLGLFGEYLGRAYQELKQRPLYVLAYDSSEDPASVVRARWTAQIDQAPQ